MPLFKVIRTSSIVLIFSFVLTLTPLVAQESEVIRIGVPSIPGFVPDEILEGLSDNFPDIEIQIVEYDPELLFPNPSTRRVEDYVESMQSLVQQADVLLINSQMLLAPALSNRFFLDLAPLVNADSRFGDSTFHPMVQQGLASGAQLWGLTNATSVSTVIYDQAVFDSLGITPPSAEWTIDDYRQVAETLPSISLYSPGEFVRALLGEPLYIRDGNRISPQFTQDGLLDLLIAFSDLQENGLITDTQESELTVNSITSVLNDDNLNAAPLPNNFSSTISWGFGLSEGTEQPELAYELMVYMVTEMDLARNISGFSSRNDRLTGALQNYSDSEQALINTALSAPTSPLDQLAISYLSQAMETDVVTVEDLQVLDNRLLDFVQTFTALTDDLVITLDNLPAEPAETEGAELLFGVSDLLSNVNRQGWQDAIDDFVADDPQIGAITLVSPSIRGSRIMLSEESDCFYSTSVSINEDFIPLLLSISPLIDADETFDASNLIAGDISAYELQGEIWALPIVLMPTLLQFNSDDFQTAGLPIPEFRWDIVDLIPALQQLDALDLSNDAPMILPDTDSLLSDPSILMLIAAFGGLPIDYRTSPEAIDFTSLEVVNAIRTALDLVDVGLLDYTPESMTLRQYPRLETSIYPVHFGVTYYSYDNSGVNPIVSFPQGNGYAPVSYRSGATFISRTSRYPEACYRWMRHLADNPQLFLGIPAYRSSNAAVVSTRLANDYADVLDDPNSIYFPQSFPFREQFERSWLYEAFEQYLSYGIDLEVALQQAEAQVNELRTCLDLDQPTPTSNAEMMTTVQEQVRCAIAVDPSLEGLYGGILAD